MSITVKKKQDLIKKFASGEKDTGSPEVQIAILSERITNLTEHFKKNVNDLHSRRGLIVMVNRRRTLLDYLKKKDVSRYNSVIKELDLRK